MVFHEIRVTYFTCVAWKLALSRKQRICRSEFAVAPKRRLPTDASIKALGIHEERHSVDLKLARQAPPEQAQPLFLRLVGKRLPLLRTGIGQTGDVLEVMNRLVHEDRQFGRRDSLPSTGSTIVLVLSS